MQHKLNFVFLGLGVTLLVAAGVAMLDSSDEHRHDHEEHIHLDAGTPATGAATGGSSIMDRPMPADHDHLMQVESLKDMLAKNPNDLEHWVMLGNLYFDMGRFEQALEPYEKALSLNPRDGDVRVDYAVSLFNINRTTEAIRELETVIKEQPTHQTAYYNLGVILLHSNQKDKVRDYWAKAVDINATNEIGRKAQQGLSTLR